MVYIAYSCPSILEASSESAWMMSQASTDAASGCPLSLRLITRFRSCQRDSRQYPSTASFIKFPISLSPNVALTLGCTLKSPKNFKKISMKKQILYGITYM